MNSIKDFANNLLANINVNINILIKRYPALERVYNREKFK
jgi:hypothetical protein